MIVGTSDGNSNKLFSLLDYKLLFKIKINGR